MATKRDVRLVLRRKTRHLLCILKALGRTNNLADKVKAGRGGEKSREQEDWLRQQGGDEASHGQETSDREQRERDDDKTKHGGNATQIA